MAENAAIACPECKKKFKPKAVVEGKKIKCPFCSHSFMAAASKDAKEGKNGKASKKSAKPEEEKAPAAAAATAGAPPADAKPPGEEEEGDDPYGVKNQDLTPRCPNCAKEMESANAIICLYCGYNTMTRQWNRTEKTKGITFHQHFMHLLPGLCAGLFVYFNLIFLMYYAVVSPYHVAENFMSFTDHESLRMWTTVINLFWIWAAGLFCFKKFFEKPKPDEISLD